MQDSFSILFYPKNSHLDKNKLAPIYMRITVDGKRCELSIKRKVDPTKWNPLAGKLKGSNQKSKELNRYLDDIRSKLYKIQGKFVTKGKPYTAIMIRNIFTNNESNRKTLLEIFQEHNDQIEQLVGKDYSSGAYLRYVRTKKHIENFIKQEYKRDNLFIKEVNLKFITHFEYYLKSKNIGNHNTVIKYITNLKKIIRIAYANNWINKDPFFNWKATWKPVEREVLTELEIQKMMEKALPVKRLDQVRDVFIFSCFTGLAYADIKKLSQSHINLMIDGDRWIKIKRSKTDTRSSIPLLPTAETILKKYKNSNTAPNSELLLPVISNQRMNAYLKEIAVLCKINKNLTFHLARHTFATTVTLSNGVPIESVSKMLGHRSLKTTQIYAKVIDRKLKDDMEILKNKFSLKKDIKDNVV